MVIASGDSSTLVVAQRVVTDELVLSLKYTFIFHTQSLIAKIFFSSSQFISFRALNSSKKIHFDRQY